MNSVEPSMTQTDLVNKGITSVTVTERNNNQTTIPTALIKSVNRDMTKTGKAFHDSFEDLYIGRVYTTENGKHFYGSIQFNFALPGAAPTVRTFQPRVRRPAQVPPGTLATKLNNGSPLINLHRDEHTTIERAFLKQRGARYVSVFNSVHGWTHYAIDTVEYISLYPDGSAVVYLDNKERVTTSKVAYMFGELLDLPKPGDPPLTQQQLRDAGVLTVDVTYPDPSYMDISMGYGMSNRKALQQAREQGKMITRGLRINEIKQIESTQRYGQPAHIVVCENTAFLGDVALKHRITTSLEESPMSLPRYFKDKPISLHPKEIPNNRKRAPITTTKIEPSDPLAGKKTLCVSHDMLRAANVIWARVIVGEGQYQFQLFRSINEIAQIGKLPDGTLFLLDSNNQTWVGQVTVLMELTTQVVDRMSAALTEALNGDDISGHYEMKELKFDMDGAELVIPLDPVQPPFTLEQHAPLATGVNPFKDLQGYFGPDGAMAMEAMFSALLSMNGKPNLSGRVDVRVPDLEDDDAIDLEEDAHDYGDCACVLCEELGAGSEEVDPPKYSYAAQVLQTVVNRGSEYGMPRDNHHTTAGLWRTWLTRRFGRQIDITPEDVCILNILQKLSRVGNVTHDDSLLDVAGWTENIALLEPTQRNTPQRVKQGRSRITRPAHKWSE